MSNVDQKIENVANKIESAVNKAYPQNQKYKADCTQAKSTFRLREARRKYEKISCFQRCNLCRRFALFL